MITSFDGFYRQPNLMNQNVQPPSVKGFDQYLYRSTQILPNVHAQLQQDLVYKKKQKQTNLDSQPDKEDVISVIKSLKSHIMRVRVIEES